MRRHLLYPNGTIISSTCAKSITKMYYFIQDNTNFTHN
jgi:hypothetical protein